MPRLCHVGSSRAGLWQELSDTNPQVWGEASQHRLSADTAEVAQHPAACSATALSHKTQPLGTCCCLLLKISPRTSFPCVSLQGSVIVLWLCFTKARGVTRKMCPECLPFTLNKLLAWARDWCKETLPSCALPASHLQGVRGQWVWPTLCLGNPVTLPCLQQVFDEKTVCKMHLR